MTLSLQQGAASVRVRVRVPLSLGDLRVDADVHGSTGLVDGAEHPALGLGDRETARDAGLLLLVRPHSECLSGDVLGSERCDRGAQLAAAGVDVVRRTATGVHLTAADARYLQAKLDATGHDLPLPVACR